MYKNKNRLIFKIRGFLVRGIFTVLSLDLLSTFLSQLSKPDVISEIFGTFCHSKLANQIASIDPLYQGRLMKRGLKILQQIGALIFSLKT